jgi:CRISPR/Cas system-associated exonuclease Cas4 (RecB family)
MRCHITDLTKFCRCKRKAKYSIIEKLEPKKSADHFIFGTALHSVLEQFYQNDRSLSRDVLKQIANEELSKGFMPQTLEENLKLDSSIQLINSMIDQYFYFSSMNDEGMETISTETELTFKHSSGAEIVGKPDVIVGLNGKKYVLEHKGLKDFPSLENLEMDMQVSAYLWLCSVNNIDITACLYNMIRKAIPTMPKILKSGELSKDKSQNTTYDMYCRVAAINEIDILGPEYEEILEVLKGNEFVKRERLIRTNRYLENTGNYISQIVDDFLYSLAKNIWYPNYMDKCSWDCCYKSLCRVESDGGDVELMKDMEYIVGRGRD